MTAKPASPEQSGKRWRSVAGLVLGLLLLGGAVWLLASPERDLSDSWSAIRSASPWLITAVLVLPLLNVLATAGTFHALTRRYGRVGFGEMIGLITAARLLNYLPLRPGLVGRVAYHKRVNGIRVTDSARVIVESIVLSIVGLAMLAVAAIAIPTAGLWVLAVPVALAVSVAFVGRRLTTGARWPWLAWAAAWRYADMLVWALRYAAVFAVQGEQLEPVHAAGLAVVSQVALLVPIAGNGLGIREWAVGWASAWLGAAGASKSVAAVSSAGLLGDVINRSAELVLAVPLGLIAVAWAARRVRKSGTADNPQESTGYEA
ncbi:MAG: lysylphosphatidylglycerol synthase domain-containing protein [Planctomycetota bacterium]